MTLMIFTITHNPETGETTYVTNIPLATAQGLLQEMALDAAVKKRIEEAAQAQEDAKKGKKEKGSKKAAQAKANREAEKASKEKQDGGKGDQKEKKA